MRATIVLARDEAIEAVIGQASPRAPRVARHAVEEASLSSRSSLASTSSTLTSGRSCRRPTSKSLKSCAGVILTAPVPFRVGIFVGDDRDAPADQRQDGVPADQMPVALVVGMHRDGGVAEHRLRPRGRDGDEAYRRQALDRILDVPEMALDLDLLHLEVGDAR